MMKRLAFLSSPMRMTGLLCLGLVATGFNTVAVLAGPFDQFLGTWSGRGNAIFSNAQREALICKGYYTGSNNNLKVALRCASPSQKIDMRANVHNSGGKVTGTWEERTYNATGDITGEVNGQKIVANLSGGLTGQLRLSIGDDGQLVALESQGTNLTDVRLKLSRR